MQHLHGLSEKTLYGILQELWWLVSFTLIIIVIRLCFQRCCFTPLGKWLKISETMRHTVNPNAVLEAVYSKSKQCKNLSSIAKKLEMTERQVERWLRLRRSQDKPSTLVKFTENMWMGTFYLYNFTYGMYVLWDKEWFWDLDMIVDEKVVSARSDIWWYYMISSAFYWSLTITQFWDVRRKDFWQMFVHHIATIALLSLSWLVSLYKIGSVVLLLHDAAEVILQLGKAAHCARLGGTTATFTVFAVTWVITRLILYPWWVLGRTTVRSFELNNPLYHVLNVLLWFILLLDVMWTGIIFRVSYKAVTSGQEPGDMRSSHSESETDGK